ncbi:methyltransferase [Pararhodobacter marinus]|uniref:Methyltransferase n=1 Tax=Pararhodobacter marinus TaxID=2184063 RepID=A0A2U2CIN1_9RHOB|nr:class I SAM-dependent methyltransferase [Pararhodobacter marinus]PWE31726.1 methyltransferase [Pararhodobacter marinus]
MTTRVSIEHLERLYRDTDDPWNFRSSAYERRRFRATARALPRSRYRAVLEIGCGNGALARHIAKRCDRYLGLDAMEKPLATARAALPQARFRQTLLPAPLPRGRFDLILLSEILYFLDPAALGDLARQIDRNHPRADVLCGTWLGPSGNPLQGRQALALYCHASARRFTCLRRGPGYRLDLARGLRR